MGFIQSIKTHLSSPQVPTFNKLADEEIAVEGPVEAVEPGQHKPSGGGHQVQIPSSQSTVSLSSIPVQAQLSHQHLAVTEESQAAVETVDSEPDATLDSDLCKELTAPELPASLSSTSSSETATSSLDVVPETSSSAQTSNHHDYPALDAKKSKLSTIEDVEFDESNETIAHVEDELTDHPADDQTAVQEKSDLPLQITPTDLIHPDQPLDITPDEPQSDANDMQVAHQAEEIAPDDTCNAEPPVIELTPESAQPSSSPLAEINTRTSSEEARAEAIKKDLLTPEPSQPKQLIPDVEEPPEDKKPTEKRPRRSLMKSNSKKTNNKSTHKKENRENLDNLVQDNPVIKSPSHKVPFGDKIKGIIEQVKGRVKKDPEMSSYGKQLRNGELRV